MIKITIKKEEEFIKSITVKGHSNYAEYGQDIVCAGISAVTIGGVAALINHDKSGVNYKLDEGDAEIEVKDITCDICQIILNTIIIQLKTIEQEYLKYVKVSVKEERKC